MNLKWKTIAILCLALLLNATASTSSDADVAAEYCGEKGKTSLAKNSGNQLGGTNTKALSNAADTNANLVKSIQEWRGGGNNNVRLKVVLEDPSKAQAYFTTVVSYSAWGIVLAVTSFLCCICTNLGRLFQCKCCFKPKKAYSKREKIECIMLYTIFALACGICCILGLVALTSFVNGVTEILCSFDGFRMASYNFFDQTMVKPLDNLQNVGVNNINYISSNMAAGDTVGDDADEIIGLFQNYSRDVGAINVHPNYTCSFCQSVAADSNKTVDELEANVEPGIESMKSTTETLNTQLVGANSTIIAVVNLAKQSSTSVFKFISGPWKTMTHQAITSSQPLKDQVVTMGVAFIVMAFTALGSFFELCGKYTNCTGCKFIDELDDKLGAWLIYFAWCFSFIFIIFLFIICALLLPVGVLTSDICVVIDDMPNDFEGYLGNRLPGGSLQGTAPHSILDGCFQNKSLFTLLNMTGAFSFKDTLNFNGSDSFNSSDAFSFSRFDDMHATVHSLTYNNFSSPNSTIDEDIAQAEAYNQTSLANELKVVKNNSIATVSWMQRDIDSIKLKINLLQNSTDKFKSDLTSVKPYALEIADAATSIADNGYCGFIKIQYNNLGRALCGTFLESILQLSLYCFLAGLFGLPMIYANLEINRRFGGHGEYKEGEENDSFADFGPVRGLTFQKMKTSVFGDSSADKVLPYEDQQEQQQQDVAVETYVMQTKQEGDDDFV